MTFTKLRQPLTRRIETPDGRPDLVVTLTASGDIILRYVNHRAKVIHALEKLAPPPVRDPFNLDPPTGWVPAVGEAVYVRTSHIAPSYDGQDRRFTARKGTVILRIAALPENLYKVQFPSWRTVVKRIAFLRPRWVAQEEAPPGDIG